MPALDAHAVEFQRAEHVVIAGGDARRTGLHHRKILKLHQPGSRVAVEIDVEAEGIAGRIDDRAVLAAPRADDGERLVDDDAAIERAGRDYCPAIGSGDRILDRLEPAKVRALLVDQQVHLAAEDDALDAGQRLGAIGGGDGPVPAHDADGARRQARMVGVVGRIDACAAVERILTRAADERCRHRRRRPAGRGPRRPKARHRRPCRRSGHCRPCRSAPGRCWYPGPGFSPWTSVTCTPAAAVGRAMSSADASTLLSTPSMLNSFQPLVAPERSMPASPPVPSIVRPSRLSKL